MKRTCVSALLVCALLAAGTVPAGAAQLNSEAAKNFKEGAAVRTVVTAQPEGTGPDGQTEQKIGFTGIEKTVRENNPTIKALQKTLSGIENTDIEAQFFNQYLQYDAQRSQYQAQVAIYQQCIDALSPYAEEPAVAAQLKVARMNLQMAQQSVAGINAILKNLDDAEDDAKDNLDDTVATYKRQFANTENQIVVGAQTAYLGIITIGQGLDTLDRNLAMLDRNITVVEKQVELGMASQLTLDNLKQTRRTAAAQRETLVKQQTATENQLSLLMGKPVSTTVKPTTVPQVTEKQLRDMDYNKDLEEALKNSYSIWVKQDAVRSASNDYEDDVTSTLDAYEAAKINLEAEKDSVTNSFRALYDDVQDKKRLVTEAQAALETQQKNFGASAKQYQIGMISKNDYLDAQDELTAKEEALSTAQNDLFTAYNTYDWAKRGFMSGAA